MTPEEIFNRFTYHAPRLPEEIAAYEDIRAMALHVALQLMDRCPGSRERSLAVTALEEAVFWANAAIARHGLPAGPGEDKVVIPQSIAFAEDPKIEEVKPAGTGWCAPSP